MALPPEQQKRSVRREYYSDSISGFLTSSAEKVLGALVHESRTVDGLQTQAWEAQIDILRKALARYKLDMGSKVYFEWAVPRVGKRIDVVVVLRHVIFVMEFKVGDEAFTAAALDQVWDYALDLKSFHQTSHEELVAPILVATDAPSMPVTPEFTAHDDRLYRPIQTNAADLGAAIAAVLDHRAGQAVAAEHWERGRYSPTPTIVEAALALWAGHEVEDISRNDAKGVNLRVTTRAVSDIIREASEKREKVICFVTGVPGAGKTLVGLTVATQQGVTREEHRCVFLSGNGPLVTILREALARDHMRRDREHDGDTTIGQARRRVYPFIQNVHHFRDDCRAHPGPPIEHVAIFDEAQRAWNKHQTKKFMAQKKGDPDFDHSEPEYLISCLNRHDDWAVVVCLVGGGQEINTGESGIGAWIDAVVEKFPRWRVHISPRLADSEYSAADSLHGAKATVKVVEQTELHLEVSMRAFRSEHVSRFVKAVLDHKEEEARQLHMEIAPRYPVLLTRNLSKAKTWLRERARGNQRYGLVVSSNAQRLRPHAIHVKAPVNPVHWFLGPKNDVRSSYYLEDVGTEFHVQGLELDWAGIVWDGDFRYSPRGWGHFCFKGKKWQKVKQKATQSYLKNAYRVLLTRARQGMIIVVPEGDSIDKTRAAEFYDPTFEYLSGMGLKVI